MNHPSNRVTEMLAAVSEGDKSSVPALIDAVYDELRVMAGHLVSRRPPGQSVVATELVHEAYLRLFANEAPRFENRRHFFAAAATAMRRFIVESYRRRRAQKRGGDRRRQPLVDLASTDACPPEDLLSLCDALDSFASVDPRAHQVVHLRYFLGLSVEQTAEILDISPRTAKGDWQGARMWLKRHMKNCGVRRDSD